MSHRGARDIAVAAAIVDGTGTGTANAAHGWRAVGQGDTSEGGREGDNQVE